MSPRFTLDLARPGRAQRSPWEWFVGPDGIRHLSIVGIGGVLLVILVGVGGVLPRYWRGSAPGACARSARLSRISWPFSAAFRMTMSSSSIFVGLVR